MTGRVAGMTAGGELRVLTELDPAKQPFLHHHRIDGTPVLPGVMGIEGFAEAAPTCSPPAGTSPRVEDVELLAPFKFYRDEPRTLELQALRARRRRRHARRRLPARRAAHADRRRRAGDAALHRPRPARARGARAARPGRRPARPASGVGHDAVYKVYFHGPAYQVLDRAWRDDGHTVGMLAPDLPPDHDAAASATPSSSRG